MKPILFNIWGFNIYGYGLMIALGIIVAVMLFTKRSNKEGYNEDHILNMTIIAIISGVLGGKLLYIITEFKAIIENPEILKDFGAGFVIYGAILGGILSVYLYAKRKKWNVLEIFDLVIPGLAFAQGLGRIGCLFAGCCYGTETTSELSIVFTQSPFAPNNVHLHPTQIYSAIFDLMLGFLLLWYDKRKKTKGGTFILYLICYSVGRFTIEFLRNDPRGNVGMLSTSQFISIIVFIVSVYMFNKNRIKEKKIENHK